MHKYILLIVCFMLIISLAACQGERPDADNSAVDSPSALSEADVNSIPLEQSVSEQSEDEDEYYYPTPENTIVSDEILFGADESIREGLPVANLKDSYAFIKSLNSGDVFFWDYEKYLPRFSDEIRYDGANSIQQYYEEMAGQEDGYVKDFIDRGFEGFQYPKAFITIGESPYSTRFVTYQNYAVEILEPYLTVTFGSYVYLGGTHGFDSRWCDNFDMQSGKKLELDDVFLDLKRDSNFLNEYINYALNEVLGDNHAKIDIMEWRDKEEVFSHAFRLTKEGVQILFGSYETGPYANGMPVITLPYNEIQSIIKIDIPD